MPVLPHTRGLFVPLFLVVAAGMSAAALLGCSDTTQRIEEGSNIQQALQQEYQAKTVRVQVRSGDTTGVDITLIDPADTAATTRSDALLLARIARQQYAASDSLDEITVLFKPPSGGGAGELSRERRYRFSPSELQ